MKVSVYLSKDIHDKLCEYGELSYVVNKIFTDIAVAGYDFARKPACPGRDGCARYDVLVDNDDYNDAMINSPPNSSTYSLRRLLYWFVNERIYEELGWEVNEKAVKHQQLRKLRLLNNAVYALGKCVKECPNDEQMSECYEYLKEICKQYDNNCIKV